MPIYAGILAGGVGVAIWIGWRICSRKTLLPCPASLAWLVGSENPLARVTRSERVIQQLGLGAGARVADVGCGPGRVTIPLARAVAPGGEILAMDFQAEMLVKVAVKVGEHQLTNVRLLHGDARESSLWGNSLDGAVMVMSLGEIPEPPRVFAMIHSALKGGGRLLIAESVFDPHYIRKAKVAAMAAGAGFIEQGSEGNLFAYAIVFEKPANH